MSHYIYDFLSEEVPIMITQKMIDQLNRMVLLFEIRGENPMTLNSQLVGVHKFVFTPADRKLFFDIIGYEEKYILSVIRKIPSINIKFKVTSDPLNIMSVYLVNALLRSTLSERSRYPAIINVLNYMQYRIFTSASNKYAPHGVNEDIMQSVVESLNMKFSIRQFESWKNVMTERSRALAFEDKAHSSTLLKFNDDKKILYAITDTSTKIRSQLKIVMREYYDMKKTNTFMTSHSATTSIDGEKIIRETSNGLSSVSSFIFDKMLIKQSFIDEKYIKMTSSTVVRINDNLIRRMLSTICDEARHQMEQKRTLEVIDKKGVVIYVGLESFIEHIVHVIYSTAIENKNVNINSKIAVYNHVKNIFTAARTSNQELVNIRNSFTYLCDKTKISTRESTVSGLGIVFALYITLTSFSSF